MNQDVESCCLEVLQLLERMDLRRSITVLRAVAATGQGGREINETSTSRALEPCPAPGLSCPWPACSMWVGNG